MAGAGLLEDADPPQGADRGQSCCLAGVIWLRLCGGCDFGQ